ncbi:MAG: TlpA family protein disulfide reductase [Actinobacteria bacterium]|nr:MAG: TlpA family protein disulfide reductase [Actinomycetota bacterium]
MPVALVMVLLVILLATRDPANERLAKSPLVGKQAPPIEGVTLANEPFTLDRVRGEWVVVNFFGSWAFADSPTAARQFFEKRGGDWPILVQDTDSIAVSYGVIKVPESFVVSPSGLVVAKLIGGITADRLDALIAKYSPPAVTR